MREIRVEVAGRIPQARGRCEGPVDLKVQVRGAYSEIIVPELTDYELVVLN